MACHYQHCQVDCYFKGVCVCQDNDPGKRLPLMQKKWKESVKYRLHAGGGIEKEMRNGCLLEVGEEWLGEEENL